MEAIPIPSNLARHRPAFRQRRGSILVARAALIAHAFLKNPARVAIIVPLGNRLNRTARRFDRLMARSPPAPPAGRRTPAAAPAPGPPAPASAAGWSPSWVSCGGLCLSPRTPSLPAWKAPLVANARRPPDPPPALRHARRHHPASRPCRAAAGPAAPGFARNGGPARVHEVALVPPKPHPARPARDPASWSILTI